MPVAQSPYALDNDQPTAAQMLGCLSAILDEFSRSRLRRAGVRDDGRCLELGAGNGSVAAWLAEEMCPYGRVVAVDIKPQHVAPHPRVTVLGRDVVAEGLPAGPFDLIHARLLLAHLPQREDLVARLADLLTPGGWLSIEEWGGAGPARILCAADPGAPELFGRYNEALLSVLAGHGNDPSWSVQAHTAMLDAGLVTVDTAGHTRSWEGGSAGCLLPVAVSIELENDLVAAGLTLAELARLRTALVHPDTVLLGNLTLSHLGSRPR